MPLQVVEAAARFGYRVRVDQIERQEDRRRDVFAIREISGRAFGVSESGAAASRSACGPAS